MDCQDGCCHVALRSLRKEDAVDYWSDVTRELRGSKPWWFVWCHERCRKAGNAAYCNMLNSKLRRVNAQLICHETVDGLGSWLSSTLAAPLILMTDWCLAKSCWTEIERFFQDKQPVLMVVFCKFKRESARAEAWANGLSTGSCRVHICRTLEVVDAIIASTAGTPTTASPVTPLTRTSPSQSHTPLSSGQESVDMKTVRRTSVGKKASSHSPSSVATELHSIELIFKLQTVIGGSGLQDMLQAAAPDHYDD
mmetsp:Transcript_18106/g.54656  ORF Transcript_18106/g.54656 Transcript_18106/m.54656 type:complete len:252 (+) Transcript_18106:40-795(+)